MTKYHIKADGSRGVCHATKRACRYSEHVTENQQSSSTPADEQQLKSLLDDVEKDRIKSIRTTRLNPPASQYLYTPGSAFSFETDYYTEPGDELTNEYYDVDMRNVLAYIHDVNEMSISDEYVQHAKNDGWAAPENYDIERTWGYYGEVDVSVQLKPELLKKVEEYYWKMDNAKDVSGVLEYCRGKGYPTEGRTPVEALKFQLKKENAGKPHAQVDKANMVDVRKINLENIRIPAVQHYGRVEPRKPEPVYEGQAPISGVVTMDANGRYSLVDGYHRTKFLDNTRRRVKQGYYFVLSHSDEPDVL